MVGLLSDTQVKQNTHHYYQYCRDFFFFLTCTVYSRITLCINDNIVRSMAKSYSAKQVQRPSKKENIPKYNGSRMSRLPTDLVSQ